MKLFVWTLLFLSTTAWAQKQELAFTLGRTTNDLGTALSVRTSSGKALQINYGYRVWGNDEVAVSGEFHFLANPLRNVIGSSTLTRDFASLYLTPRSPRQAKPEWADTTFRNHGGGYALYEQSTETIGGGPNPAPRHINRGAIAYGGGLDVKIVRWLAVRGDIRDFYTGRPALNLLTS